MRVAAVIPAYQAEHTVGAVVQDLRKIWPGGDGRGSIIVVDDGSRDDTVESARGAGALVVCHGRNLGKGAALRTGLKTARKLGFEAVVTVDADGQHLAEEAVRLAQLGEDPEALLLGVRDLGRDGAPRANRISNGISNFFLSMFARRPLADTQCGLRRYPVEATLTLDGRALGYAFEAEILLLAVRRGLPIVEVPVRVLYDPEQRTTHFDSVRDPARIIARVVLTLARRR